MFTNVLLLDFSVRSISNQVEHRWLRSKFWQLLLLF